MVERRPGFLGLRIAGSIPALAFLIKIDRTVSRGFPPLVNEERMHNWMVKEIIFDKEVNDNER